MAREALEEPDQADNRGSARAMISAPRARGRYGHWAEVARDHTAEAVAYDRHAELSFRVSPAAGAARAEVTEGVRVGSPDVESSIAPREPESERDRPHVADFEAERERDDAPDTWVLVLGRFCER